MPFGSFCFAFDKMNVPAVAYLDLRAGSNRNFMTMAVVSVGVHSDAVFVMVVLCGDGGSGYAGKAMGVRFAAALHNKCAS